MISKSRDIKSQSSNLQKLLTTVIVSCVKFIFKYLPKHVMSIHP